MEPNFHIWANKILKDYLVKGYTLNEKRIKEQSRQLDELKHTVKLLANVMANKDLNSNEATGQLKVIIDDAYALDVLDKHDHQILEIHDITSKELFKITYTEAIKAIGGLRGKFGGSTLFGNEKDESFKVRWGLFIKLSTETAYIQVLKKRLQICYTS